MNRLLSTLAALAAGAAAMYYFDPQTGRGRRAAARDRFGSMGRDVGALAAAKGKRVADHARGALAEASSRLGEAEAGSDLQLHERVRARLGHLIEDARAVVTEVDQGCVRLSGTVRARELERLIDELSQVPGVERVESRLIPRGAPGEGMPH